MKRIPRNPLRFDVFGLFAIHAQQQQIAIHNSEAHEGFLARVRSTIDEALKSEAFVYGHHTQSLFESLILSLNAVRLLKQEDAGDLYADEDLQLPDYRAILADGQQVLVEVKNLYQDEPVRDPLRLAKDYFDDLRRYADLMACPLRLAVFWVRWNIWTLVRPDAFVLAGERYELPFLTAMRNDDMALLGDKHLGTKFPLRMRFIADPTKSRAVDASGNATITFS